VENAAVSSFIATGRDKDLPAPLRIGA